MNTFAEIALNPQPLPPGADVARLGPTDPIPWRNGAQLLLVAAALDLAGRRLEDDRFRRAAHLITDELCPPMPRSPKIPPIDPGKLPEPPPPRPEWALRVASEALTLAATLPASALRDGLVQQAQQVVATRLQDGALR